MKKVMGAGGCFCCAGGGCACPNSAAVPSAKRVTAFIFPPGSDLARSLLRFRGARHNYSVIGSGEEGDRTFRVRRRGGRIGVPHLIRSRVVTVVPHVGSWEA